MLRDPLMSSGITFIETRLREPWLDHGSPRRPVGSVQAKERIFRTTGPSIVPQMDVIPLTIERLALQSIVDNEISRKVARHVSMNRIIDPETRSLGLRSDSWHCIVIADHGLEKRDKTGGEQARETRMLLAQVVLVASPAAFAHLTFKSDPSLPFCSSSPSELHPPS